MTSDAPAPGSPRGLGQRRLSPETVRATRRDRPRAPLLPAVGWVTAVALAACNTPAPTPAEAHSRAHAAASTTTTFAAADLDPQATCMGQVDDTTPARLRPIATSFCVEAASFKTTGAALSVETPRGESMHLTYGRRCRGQPGGVNLRTAFRWGSISKVVTGLAVLAALISRGSSPDAPIGSWFPELDGSWVATLTVRSLLTHTSGLNAFDEDGAVASLSDFLTWVGEHPPTASTSAHAYRNTDHILLGVLLERVTGRPFEVAIREHVLAPLDLDLLVDPFVSPVDNASCGHITGEPPLALGDDYRVLLAAKPWLRPAGAISGSAVQLARLGLFFLRNEGEPDPLARAGAFMSIPAGVAADHGPAPLTRGAILFTPGLYAGQRAPSRPTMNHAPPAIADVLYHRGATPAFHADLVIFSPQDDVKPYAGGGVISVLDNSGHMYGATLAAASRALSNLKDEPAPPPSASSASALGHPAVGQPKSQ